MESLVHSGNDLETFASHLKRAGTDGRVLVVEPTGAHQEVIPSLIHYFTASGIGVDVLLKADLPGSRRIEPVIRERDGLDCRFFYVLSERHAAYLTRLVTKNPYPYVYVNTVYEHFIREAHTLRFIAEATSAGGAAFATCHSLETYAARRRLFPAIRHENVFVLGKHLAERHGMPFMIPCVFYQEETAKKPEDGDAGIISVGGVERIRKDYDQLIDACIALRSRLEARGQKIRLACTPSNSEYNRLFELNLARYALHGVTEILAGYSFPDLFAVLRKTLFQLFLLNPRSRFSAPYRASKISGGLNLSLGFGLLPVVETAFAREWGIEAFSVTYDGTDGLIETLDGITRDPARYAPRKHGLLREKERLMDESLAMLQSRL